MDGSFLTKKLGPFPYWAYIGVAVAALIIYTSVKKKSSTGGTPTSTSLPTGTQLDPQGLTVVNEGYNPPSVTVNNGPPAVVGREASAYAGTYVVKPGDTLNSILAMFYKEKPGSTQQMIETARISAGNNLQWNQSTQQYDITPGQSLKLYSDAGVGVGDNTFSWQPSAGAPIVRSNAVAVAPSTPAPRTVTVTPWDASNPWSSTLSGIAQHFYNDASAYTRIAQVNGIANPNLIHPGQTLVVP